MVTEFESSDVVGLVPCGGRGSRLGLPFSKEMYPDVGRDSYQPIILNTIVAMKTAGIRHLIFTINPSKVDLLKYLGNGKQFGLDFSFCVHPEPKSLPASLNEAQHLIRNKTVVMAMPDTLIKPSTFLLELLQSHKEAGKMVTLGCFRTDTPQKFGMVSLKDSGSVSFVMDKPSQTHLQWMWGCIAWNQGFTEELDQFVQEVSASSSAKEPILTDAMANLFRADSVGAHLFIDGQYRDLGTYDELVRWATIGIGS